MAEEAEVQSMQDKKAEDILQELPPENDLSGDEEVKNDDSEPFIEAEEVPTTSPDGNIMSVNTTLPSSPPIEIATTAPSLNKEPICYVDERSKAMDRKAELEALRNRNELTKRKGMSNESNN